eukprot:1008301-Pelagomonas_calceolata.AAC.17
MNGCQQISITHPASNLQATRSTLKANKASQFLATDTCQWVWNAFKNSMCSQGSPACCWAHAVAQEEPAQGRWLREGGKSEFKSIRGYLRTHKGP